MVVVVGVVVVVVVGGGGGGGGGVGVVEPPPPAPPLPGGFEGWLCPEEDVLPEPPVDFAAEWPAVWCGLPEAVVCPPDGFDACRLEEALLRCELWLVVDPACTTTFCAGGRLEWEPGPATRGRCTVPELASRTVAPAPSRRGMSGAATRRAAIQIGRPVRRSLADNGPRSPFPTVLPRPRPRIQETPSDGKTSARRNCALSGRFRAPRPGAAATQPARGSRAPHARCLRARNPPPSGP